MDSEQLAPAGPRSTGQCVAPGSPSTVDASCEVINGMAVHDGDIVVGTVEEVAALHKSRLAIKNATGSWPVRRDISPVEDKYLWPDGVVPHVIDPDFNEEGVQSIQAAIDHWNSKTVITLVERTTESDFVRFRHEGDSWCAAELGRRGRVGGHIISVGTRGFLSDCLVARNDWRSVRFREFL